MGMGFGLHLEMRMAMTCIVCKQEIDRDRQQTDLVMGELVGAVKYGQCPACQQEVPEERRTEKYKARWLRRTAANAFRRTVFVAELLRWIAVADGAVARPRVEMAYVASAVPMSDDKFPVHCPRGHGIVYRVWEYAEEGKPPTVPWLVCRTCKKAVQQAEDGRWPK